MLHRVYSLISFWLKCRSVIWNPRGQGLIAFADQRTVARVDNAFGRFFCVVSRMRVEEFFDGMDVQSLSQCQTSQCFLTRSLWTHWFRCCRAAVLVSKNVHHVSIFWSVSSHSTQRMVEQCFSFCLARLIDTTSWTHLAAAHTNVSASHCAHHPGIVHELHP